MEQHLSPGVIKFSAHVYFSSHPFRIRIADVVGLGVPIGLFVGEKVTGIGFPARVVPTAAARIHRTSE